MIPITCAKMRPLGSVCRVQVMRTSQVQKKVLEYLADRPDENAFLRSEFSGCAQSRAGIDKALRALVEKGVLVRLGYGVLARGEMLPELNMTGLTQPISVLVKEALTKLGADPKTDSALRAYNEDQTTQIPVWLAFEIGDKRISRKIGFGQRWVNYERNGK